MESRLKSPSCYFFGIKAVKYQISSFCLTKDITVTRTTYNDVLYAEVCVQRCELWPWRSYKKDKNFHESKLLFAQTSHVDVAP